MIWSPLLGWTKAIPSTSLHMSFQAIKLVLSDTCTSSAAKKYFSLEEAEELLSRTEMQTATEILYDIWCAKFSLYWKDLAGSTTRKSVYEEQLRVWIWTAESLGKTSVWKEWCPKAGQEIMSPDCKDFFKVLTAFSLSYQDRSEIWSMSKNTFWLTTHEKSVLVKVLKM